LPAETPFVTSQEAAGSMIFRQITHDDLGCASYLIGDEEAGVAAVVDPRFEIDEYLDLARYMDVTIEHVFETHNHADHVSGHGRLAAATGAQIHINGEADVAYAHRPMADGEEVRLGAVIVRAVHTPGHRPEHTAYLLIDTQRGPDPWAVLTGDSLFVGDVARPDLAVDKVDGARGIFRSLHRGLLNLPADVEVWPGHLGGSMCGGPGMDMKISSTVGFERDHNPMLAVEDEGEFVSRAIAALGPQPPNFTAIVALNRGPLVVDGAHLHPLTPRQIDQQRREGALIVDVRSDRQFDDAHIPGSISIPALRAGFGTKLAWLADRQQPVAFVGRDDDDGRRAATLGEAVGLTRFAGFLHGGMTSWRQEGRPAGRIERTAIGDLAARLSADPAIQVLDVREVSEWEEGHIPGAAFCPWHDLRGVPDGLDPARRIAVVCGSGQRAGVAASLLARDGARRVIHVVDGGVPAWERLGHPVERPRPDADPVIPGAAG
jgi:glyoxylase-like metal-dependent hydrolase (beta-lactamase superfamily II)/rhodanese-related sulfurtransferase